MSDAKVIATYLYGKTSDSDWPDVVNLVPAGDPIDGEHRVLMSYVRGDEAKEEHDYLEKTIIALVAYIERDGELLMDHVPHFAQRLAEMGLYDMGIEADDGC